MECPTMFLIWSKNGYNKKKSANRFKTDGRDLAPLTTHQASHVREAEEWKIFFIASEL